MHTKWYLSCGGGLGDCLWHILRDRPFWWLPHLVRDMGCRIQVYTACHNDGVLDLFKCNPYIHEHIAEDWHPPCMDDVIRFSQPIDGYYPLNRMEYVQHEIGYEIPCEEPQIYLTDAEQSKLGSLLGQRPLIVAQPFAGLSDRDGFDAASFERLVKEIVYLDPRVRIVVLGKNHERGHKYAEERLSDFVNQHPNVINGIDKVGIRLGWHLVKHCDAFIGCHSNLIRVAWDFRKRNICVLPEPLMTNHLPNLDGKYRYGFNYGETKIFTYPFDGQGPRQFDKMDFVTMAHWILGRS